MFIADLHAYTTPEYSKNVKEHKEVAEPRSVFNYIGRHHGFTNGDDKRYWIEEDLGYRSNLTLERAIEIIKDYEDQIEKERQEYKQRN